MAQKTHRFLVLVLVLVLDPSRTASSSLSPRHVGCRFVPEQAISLVTGPVIVSELSPCSVVAIVIVLASIDLRLES